MKVDGRVQKQNPSRSKLTIEEKWRHQKHFLRTPVRDTFLYSANITSHSPFRTFSCARVRQMWRVQRQKAGVACTHRTERQARRPHFDNGSGCHMPNNHLPALTGALSCSWRSVFKICILHCMLLSFRKKKTLCAPLQFAKVPSFKRFMFSIIKFSCALTHHFPYFFCLLFKYPFWIMFLTSQHRKESRIKV